LSKGDDSSQRLDKFLAQTVSAGTLTGYQQNVSGMDVVSKIAVAPVLVRRAGGAEDKAFVIHTGGAVKICGRRLPTAGA
jgi:hypothetical protein